MRMRPVRATSTNYDLPLALFAGIVELLANASLPICFGYFVGGSIRYHQPHLATCAHESFDELLYGGIVEAILEIDDDPLLDSLREVEFFVDPVYKGQE